MNVKKELIFPLFYEQIYKKNRKNNNYQKQVVAFDKLETQFLSEEINVVIKSKYLWFLYCIQRYLSEHSSNAPYYELQLVHLSYKDDLIMSGLGRKLNNFYSIRQKFIDKEILFHIKGSTYLVNPYYICNIKRLEWKQMQLEFRDYESKEYLSHQSEIMNNGLNLIPPLP